jgi:hypothetical protein
VQEHVQEVERERAEAEDLRDEPVRGVGDRIVLLGGTAGPDVPQAREAVQEPAVTDRVVVAPQEPGAQRRQIDQHDRRGDGE